MRIAVLIMAPGRAPAAGPRLGGFYRIALTAKLPVALGFVDYARREAGILAYVTLSGDPATDIATLARHYAGRTGKHPELASPVTLRLE